MKLYNTLTKQLEEFQPLEDKKVKFYHCGPTVYWTQHIGNLRAMTMGDLIRRSLMYLGYDVNYVRNYTDVGHLTSDADEGEDKMEKGAKREGLTPDQIADKYIQIFENDIKEINLLEPSHKSKATAQIDEIIEMIKILLSKKAAYITPKAVYFDVTHAKDYPAFSSKKLEDQIEGAGKGDITDPNKKHPADFALWFFKTGAHKNALQFWPAPFESPEVQNGEGFPGWHIECSVIAQTFLGKQLDIHMGGVEHIAIHHPNEIAQSEAANEQKFANYWLHNEHLLVDDKKMSKSEGTGFSLEQIKEKGFDPMDLRYFFLTAHYRSKQNFTWEALGAARTRREKIIKYLHDTGSTSLSFLQNEHKPIEKYQKKFIAALEDDINIPKALAILSEVLKSREPIDRVVDTILDFDKVLGLNIQQNVLLSQNFPRNFSTDEITAIESGIEEREEAKKAKDYEKADLIRKNLQTKYGIILKDNKDGETTWFQDIKG